MVAYIIHGKVGAKELGVVGKDPRRSPTFGCKGLRRESTESQRKYGGI